MVLSAIIVDDEEYGRKNLKTMLNNYCKNIEIIALTKSVVEAIEVLGVKVPDIIFLDIKMPGKNGFDFVNDLALEDKPFIVFVTAYNNYAIKAIKHNAFDYILKPIDIDELQECERKLLIAAEKKASLLTNELAKYDTINSDEEKISINHSKGTKLISLKDIMYLEGHNNYTIIHLMYEQAAEKFLVSKTIGGFEEILKEKNFFRIHKSYIININEMKEYINEDNGYVIMKNNVRMEVARRKSGVFRKFLQAHYNRFGKY